MAMLTATRYNDIVNSLKEQEEGDMSLGIVIKVAEGLVLAAESRVTLGAKMTTPQGTREIPVFFDNATKLLSFSEPNISVGVVTYGQAVIGERNPRTAASFLPEFEASLQKGQRPTVTEFADRISDFYLKQWSDTMPANTNTPNMTFIVAGYNPDEVYGQVYLIEIPKNPKPVERSPGSECGITFGGQHEIMSRIMMGYDNALPDVVQKGLSLSTDQAKLLREVIKPLQLPIPLQVLALQDGVDLACFFIRATMDAQRLSIGVRGVGGAIDVAIIKRNQKLQFVQRKQEHGESG